MKDVVGISSLNVDYIYEAADLSFLQPFYPEGKWRRAWLLTDSEEIQKLKIILKEKARLISKSGGGSAANASYCLAKMGFQIGSFSIMHLTSLPGEGLKLQERLAGEMSGKMRISFDPGEVYVRQGLIALTPLLSHCSILFITEGELLILTGYPLLKAIATVQSIGTKILVIKKIGAGALIVQGAETWDLPAEIIQPKDTTGAGDVFAAGFLAGLIKGRPLPDCGRLGLILAHQSMMGLGREAYPGEEDFKKALKKVGNEARD